jgi:hypothetical protein
MKNLPVHVRQYLLNFTNPRPPGHCTIARRIMANCPLPKTSSRVSVQGMGLLCRPPHALSFRARYLKWLYYDYKEQATIVPMLWWKACSLQWQVCLCTLYPPEYDDPGDYIFKRMGRESAVNMGRNILAEEIDKVETIFKAKIHAVDSREVVFPTSKTRPSAGVASPCESLDDVF